jgi:hypothetical protein
VHTLNTVQDGLEYLDWYGNIQSSLRLMNLSLQIEDEHLEAEQEDRITRTDE